MEDSKAREQEEFENDAEADNRNDVFVIVITNSKLYSCRTAFLDCFFESNF